MSDDSQPRTLSSPGNQPLRNGSCPPPVGPEAPEDRRATLLATRGVPGSYRNKRTEPLPGGPASIVPGSAPAGGRWLTRRTG